MSQLLIILKNSLIYISLKHERYIIEWEGHGPAEAIITEETLFGLANQHLDDIIVRTYFFTVHITFS